MSRFYVALKVSFLSGFVITLHCLISLSQRPYFSKINFIPNLQSEININNLLPMQCVLYAVNIKCRVLCTRVNIVNQLSAYHHIQPWQVHTCSQHRAPFHRCVAELQIFMTLGNIFAMPVSCQSGSGILFTSLQSPFTCKYGTGHFVIL